MIRTLVVDDSPTVRRHLVSALGESADFEVVGEAASGEEAVRDAARLRPDIVSLDVFLPGESAAAVVRRLMAALPVPIVLVSDAPRDSVEVFEALAAGALDFARKPRPDDAASTASLMQLLRALSRVKVQRRPNPPPVARATPNPGLLAVASSTGGPGALRDLLARLPVSFPWPVAVVQHIAQGFEDGLAEWLGRACEIPVRLSRERESLQPGAVLLGRSEFDLAVTPRGWVELRPAPPLGYHPSADVLFETAAKVFGAGAVAVVLSGVGRDGARGAQALAAAGGTVLAQSQASAIVWGMPGAATDAGVVSASGTPDELAQWVLEAAAGRRAATPAKSRRRRR